MSAVAPQMLDDLPTPKAERWKYTNLPAALRGMDLTGAGGNLLRVEGAEAYLRRLSGANDELRRLLPDGEVARRAADARGFAIDIPPFHSVDKPVEILVEGKVDGDAPAAMVIRLGAGASATVVEKLEGDGCLWHNGVTGIELGDGACLYHHRIQVYGDRPVYTQTTNVTLGRDATYDAFTLTAGAALSRNEVAVTMTGPGGHAELNGIMLLDGARHGDTTLLVDHQAPHCTSHQFYRSVLDGRARGVFQGKIHVARAAQKTDGYQMSRALILSEGAEMDMKPELEIYADDVKCSHGATTGQLDDEALFYLRSRGIGHDDARRLLIGAFVGEAVDKIADQSVREQVETRVEAWLGR